MKTLPLTLCAAALLGGIVALLVWGASPPVWLATLEAALLMGAALVYGYFGRVPAMPRWVWLRPVRGTVLVCLGIVAMYVPPQLVLAAFLVGAGVRLVWQSACQLDRRDALSAGSASPDATSVEQRGVTPHLTRREPATVARIDGKPPQLPSKGEQLPAFIRPAVAVTVGVARASLGLTRPRRKAVEVPRGKSGSA